MIELFSGVHQHDHQQNPHPHLHQDPHHHYHHHHHHRDDEIIQWSAHLVQWCRIVGSGKGTFSWL